MRTNTLPAISCAAILAAFAPGRAVLAAPIYTFSSFQVAGEQYTIPQGINDAGQVVGYAYNPAVGVGPVVVQAFIYNSVNGAITLFNLPGAVGYTVPTGINDAGEIIGYDSRGPAGSTTQALFGDRSFSRDPSGSVYTILSIPAVSASQGQPIGNDARGINNAGQIVGSVGGGPPPSFSTGFLLDAVTSAVTTLNPLSVFDNTSAFGINNLGQIVGDYTTYSPYSNGAYLRDPKTGAYTLFTDPNGTGTQVRGINDLGQIAGFYFDAADKLQSFLLDTSSGTYTTLQGPNGVSIEISGINNVGQLIGGYTDIAGNSHAFIATPTIATVPEPATLALLATSAFGLLAWRRRIFSL